MRHSLFPAAIVMAALLSSFVPSSARAGGDVAGAPAAMTIAPPPPESLAVAALNHSPRHGEFVDVKRGNGEAPIRTWVVYPERPDKAGVVIVIHEIFGLTDWVRAVADRLAAEGFIAVAPDLISGMGPDGGGTDSTKTRDQAVQIIRMLTPDETRARLDIVRAYVMKIPAANGRIGTIGFCWGGGRSFEYAAADPPPQATVVYYGTSPDSATLARVAAPVIGFYGGDDARVDATIPPAREELDRLGRSYQTHVFDGAGHGFLRAQGLRDGANLAASRKSWPLAIAFLREHLEGKEQR